MFESAGGLSDLGSAPSLGGLDDLGGLGGFSSSYMPVAISGAWTAVYTGMASTPP